MDIRRLTDEHRGLVSGAAALAGLASAVRTSSDADEALDLIGGVERLLSAHAEAENRDVYSLLMADPDPAVQACSSEAFEEVSGLLGAWRQFRLHWTREAILADPRRFALTAGCALEALRLRVALEEETLYPAAVARSTSAAAA